jgi:hypothetical protein
MYKFNYWYLLKLIDLVYNPTHFGKEKKQCIDKPKLLGYWVHSDSL